MFAVCPTFRFRSILPDVPTLQSCSMVQDELIKSFERVQASQDDRTAVDVGCWCRCVLCDPQAVVDYLKQYDKDTKGALSPEEVQAAIRGTVRCVPGEWQPLGWFDFGAKK